MTETFGGHRVNVLARFDVGGAEDRGGISLLRDASFSEREESGGHVLCRQPSGRYYVEDAWRFQIADAELRTRKDVALEVEYWDEGFGTIEARRLVDAAFRGKYAAAARGVSYTRVNTRKYRCAAFHFAEAPAANAARKTSQTDRADFELTGIQHLRSVRLIETPPSGYWDDLQSRIPSRIRPAIELERPMQVVCSAGVEVHGTLEGGILYRSVANLREYLPLAKALGFNAIEAYVRWDLVEPAPGRFDWTFYDALVDEIQRYGLKWFPLLIVGSAYSLPEWFHNSSENVGFVCLEHGLSNAVQSIWSPFHKKHVTRFLEAFGRHYEPKGSLQGVRLGPSGCYGESQYPAQGDWGFKGGHMHVHIGMWAGDPYALEDIRRFLREKYVRIEALNAAWEDTLASFDDVALILPDHCHSKRRRLDTYAWYTDSMTAWCEWWAIEARKAMPHTPIYQSSGGWGAAEIGTDYSAQTKSMLKINGGIRLTNELDSFHQSFYATRLAATAARCYGVPLGFEPAMGHTGRGTAGRLFNCVSNGGEHFFTYGGNVFNRQTSIENWLRHYRLFDLRAKPLVEIALYYPQTMNFLCHDTFRYLNAWGFNPIAREIRDRIEVDYLDDRLIRDGFLERYRVLVFVWGNQIEQDALEKIDAWLRAGGTLIFPCALYSVLGTIEGDASVFDRWASGDVGEGRFFRHVGDDEPPTVYAEFVRESLLELPSLSHATRTALELARLEPVFISAQADGALLVLNFQDKPVRLEHPATGVIEIAAYAIERVLLNGAHKR